MPVPSPPLPPSPGDCPSQGLDEEIRAELAAAGLPVLPPGHGLQPQQASGVSVEADEDGVWVSWEIRGLLGAASQRAFEVGAYRPGSPGEFVSHPAMQHWQVAKCAVTDAIAAILGSLGYGMKTDADEYRPGELLVSPRAPGPHWRDPAVPPLAGSSGYSPGVRVRLLSGEFAGSVTTIVTGTYSLSAPGPPLRYSVKHPNGESDLDIAPQDVTLAGDDA